jgi:rubrerythrin
MKFDSVREVLEYSMEKEKEAAEFYEDLSKNETYPAAKKTFEQFAVEERKHYKLFEGYLSDPEKVESYEIEKIEDLKISEYLQEVSYRPGMPYNELIKLAMKREEKALAFYKDMAQKVQEPAIAKTLTVLAQEEAKHKSILEQIYDDFLANHDF